MKSIVKKLLPRFLRNLVYKIIIHYEKNIPIHIRDVFGFDLYQNSYDIINYKKFCGKMMSEVYDSADGRVFYTMNKYIDRGSIAIDVGANIGLMTLTMGKLVGSTGKVYSFEPGPVSFGLLRRNVFTNALNGNIFIFDQALSDSEGHFNLFINLSGESDNQLHKNLDDYSFKNENSRPSIKVMTKTLDSIIQEQGINISEISFIKIDTQGHDLSVLRGGKHFFKSVKKVAVLVEFAPYLKAWENQSIDEFYIELVSSGFAIYDNFNLSQGAIGLDYLKSNFGHDFVGKYTDLLLLKGQEI
jgi:FkbM family methyltransferase